MLFKMNETHDTGFSYKFSDERNRSTDILFKMNIIYLYTEIERSLGVLFMHYWKCRSNFLG